MNSTSEMTPTDVAQLIKATQTDARAKLDELSRVAKSIATAGPTEFARVIRLTRTLYAELKAQIAVEMELLVPALRSADAWGKVRADRLIGQLRTRRKELKSLRKSYSKAEQSTLGADIERFVDGRRAGMAAADRDTLSPNVLRDDVLGVDVNGG
jgi:hypothetical protein